MQDHPLGKEEEKPDPEIIKAAGEDGRNREWEDRARVNLEKPGKESTNLERDFEPEQEPDKKDERRPAY